MTTKASLADLAPADATDIRLVVLDRDGDVVARGDRFLDEYARTGCIAGIPDACIGVRYYDERHNDLSLAISIEEARSLVGGAS